MNTKLMYAIMTEYGKLLLFIFLYFVREHKVWSIDMS